MYLETPYIIIKTIVKAYQLVFGEMRGFFRVSPLVRRAALTGVSLLSSSLAAGALHCTAVASPSRDAKLDALPTLKGSYRGQLTPENAPSVEHDGMRWQRGPFYSWWLRVGAIKTPSFAAFSEAIDEVLQRASGSAAYVAIDELSMAPWMTGLLRSKGFRFHHFHAARGVEGELEANDESRPGELVYYQWLGDPSHDMVPCYATSIEGVGALVLSPDESKVLLVWEYGQWKPVTGAVDAGESKITSLARELGEEVGSELDLSFAPRYLGGWQISKARDKLTNDNFSSFVVRAKTADFAVDGKEIVAAKWFDRTELMAAFKAAGSPQPMGTITLEDPERELGERTKVSTNALNWLANYESGASLLVRLQSRNGFQQIMNIGGTAPPVKA